MTEETFAKKRDEVLQAMITFDAGDAKRIQHFLKVYTYAGVGAITVICYLIGHHHTYKDVDGADYQLLLEADFLVNAYEDALSPKAILAFREKVFRTASGTAMLNAVYGLD